jgi:Ni/Fe-hydrogenase 1 B-type cytochrome subunit
MFLVFLFQVISGFAMYASMSKSWFPQLFRWAVPLFGGDFALRQWHYMAMWFFIVFTIVHVYLVFYHDYVEGHGVMSSMVGGWKFVRPDMLKGNGRSWFPLSPRSPRSEPKSAPRRPS